MSLYSTFYLLLLLSVYYYLLNFKWHIINIFFPVFSTLLIETCYPWDNRCVETGSNIIWLLGILSIFQIWSNDWNVISLYIYIYSRLLNLSPSTYYKLCVVTRWGCFILRFLTILQLHVTVEFFIYLYSPSWTSNGL